MTDVLVSTRTRHVRCWWLELPATMVRAARRGRSCRSLVLEKKLLQAACAADRRRERLLHRLVLRAVVSSADMVRRLFMDAAMGRQRRQERTNGGESLFVLVAASPAAPSAWSGGQSARPTASNRRFGICSAAEEAGPVPVPAPSDLPILHRSLTALHRLCTHHHRCPSPTQLPTRILSPAPSHRSPRAPRVVNVELPFDRRRPSSTLAAAVFPPPQLSPRARIFSLAPQRCTHRDCPTAHPAVSPHTYTMASKVRPAACPCRNIC